MTPHPWVAIDPETDRRSWARELARAHERAIRGGEPQPDVREVITASWSRCERAGVDPASNLASIEYSAEEAEERWQSSPLSVAGPILTEVLADVGPSGQVVLACDRDGTILWTEGDPSLLATGCDVNVTPGARWDEPSAGTNAMGTALAAGHPLQVFSAEHFSIPIHEWTCSAAPVTDPETGERLGVLDLSGEFSTAHPYSLALVSAAARMVEAELKRQAAIEAAELREKFIGVIGSSNGRPVALSSAAGRVIETRLPELDGQRLQIPSGGGDTVSELGLKLYAEPVECGGFLIWRTLTEAADEDRSSCSIQILNRDRATVRSGGSTLELSPRHSEILVLLSLRPEGMTAEQLALELYGDFGKPVTARVEVARARRKLGDLIAPDHYRLTRPLLGDFIEVEELASSGRAREALARYAGALLPHSEVPLVVERRQHLDDLVRIAVLESGEADLLEAWLEQPTGRDDVEVCKRLARMLPPEDLRRPKALSRLRRLCAPPG